MKLRCFIIESDSFSLNFLSDCISNFPNLEITGQESDPIIAIQKISSQESLYDLIFFDLDLYNMSIVHFLQIIKEQTNYIFTTRSELINFWGANNRKINLLKKPFRLEEVRSIVNNIVKTAENHKLENQVEGLRNFSIVDFDNKGTFINIKEIIYVQALSNYAKVYMSSGNEYTLHLSLKEIMIKLPNSSFQRTHKSYIINLNFVNYIIGNVIQMKKNVHIPIGPLFKDALIQYLNSTLNQPFLK